ncbi:MAG: hypothetical protein HOW73_34075 [Polyangiaceae bacterium]|nr:hypothetical protein [Polyangiaceae bacterium]
MIERARGQPIEIVARLFFLAALSGCATETLFEDKPIVWRVDDDRSIAEPKERHYNRYTHYGDVFFGRAVDRALSLPYAKPPRDINALDEVPDSTWFENRIGRYDLTPADVARGPGGDPPMLPLTIVKGKADGSNPGFVVVDAKKRRYLIKLDPVAQPEMQTSNSAIASRLFWALGYHVPSEHVVGFSRADLKIDPKATYDDKLDEDLPLTWKYVDHALSLSAGPTGDVYRATASMMLSGKPKGGFPDKGVREDDPNDIIPHESRRSLRGLQVFCAWLDHTDMNPQNTMDMYVEEDGRKFLRHHLLDFGETLGAHALDHPWVSYAYLVDGEYFFGSLFSFGLWKRPWEGEPGRPFQSVGLYFPTFDPTTWKEAKPYYPFAERTRADEYWAAKIVMRLSRAHIEAAVGTAKMSDAAATGYLVETLLARQRSIGRAYLNTVTSVDWFEVTRERLCMVDLSVHYALARGGVAEKMVDGHVVERAQITKDGRACFDGPGDEPYMRYQLRVVRDQEELPGIEVHVHGGREPRIQGVVRDF